MRRDLKRRLARLGAERLTPEAIGAAFAALDRGDEPEPGEAGERARYLRAFLLFATAQTIGGGELTDEVVEDVGRGMAGHDADLERARRLLDEWWARYSDQQGGRDRDHTGPVSSGPGS